MFDNFIFLAVLVTVVASDKRGGAQGFEEIRLKNHKLIIKIFVNILYLYNKTL